MGVVSEPKREADARTIIGRISLLGFILSTSVALAQHTYSKAVQKACAQDYKAHCGQYGNRRLTTLHGPRRSKTDEDVHRCVGR